MSRKSDIKKQRKFASRKFIALLLWLPYVWYILIKSPSVELVKEITPWFGGVTMIYVGFQAVVDFIPAVVKIIKAIKGQEEEIE